VGQLKANGTETKEKGTSANPDHEKINSNSNRDLSTRGGGKGQSDALGTIGSQVEKKKAKSARDTHT